MKYHLVGPEPLPLCGGSGSGLYADLSDSIDPDDICKRCQKKLLAIGQKDFGQFIFIVNENS
jgi:hypothetical protein